MRGPNTSDNLLIPLDFTIQSNEMDNDNYNRSCRIAGSPRFSNWQPLIFKWQASEYNSEIYTVRRNHKVQTYMLCSIQ